MALDFRSDPLAELTHFRELGVDGVFVDCPSTAREWLAALGLQRQGGGAWLPYGLRLPGMLPPPGRAEPALCVSHTEWGHMRGCHGQQLQTYRTCWSEGGVPAHSSTAASPGTQDLHS